MDVPADDEVARLRFRRPDQVRALEAKLAEVVREMDRDVAVMHVCGSHEQAIARFGLRAAFPERLDVIMGPGCPVCITDAPEIDAAVAMAKSGITVATYGDMIRVRGSHESLADARAAGGVVEVVYGVDQAVALAHADAKREVVFFASGFETTAVATAAALLSGPPANFAVLSAHKYIPPVMEIVAEMPGTRVQGFLAAGHAAAITGWGVFEPFVERHRLPVVVAGFEPLDILAGLVTLVERIRDGRVEVVNTFPRCVTKEGNTPAQKALWSVFQPLGGRWRGIAHVPNGNLRLRDEWAAHDATKKFGRGGWLRVVAPPPPSAVAQQCRCGDIMAGLANPTDCSLFASGCTPETPVGACMVSSEGTCRIWKQYGGHPDLKAYGGASR